VHEAQFETVFRLRTRFLTRRIAASAVRNASFPRPEHKFRVFKKKPAYMKNFRGKVIEPVSVHENVHRPLPLCPYGTRPPARMRTGAQKREKTPRLHETENGRNFRLCLVYHISRFAIKGKNISP
jgi:hypothetical protein